MKLKKKNLLRISKKGGMSLSSSCSTVNATSDQMKKRKVKNHVLRYILESPLIRFLLVVAIVFYFVFSLPPAIVWTFLVNNPMFKYEEKIMKIETIKKHRHNTFRSDCQKSSQIYIKRTAYGLIDGHPEKVGLPMKLERLKVGENLDVAYCSERKACSFFGWNLRVLPMSSWKNRKYYLFNFVLAVWLPLLLVFFSLLMRTTRDWIFEVLLLK